MAKEDNDGIMIYLYSENGKKDVVKKWYLCSYKYGLLIGYTTDKEVKRASIKPEVYYNTFDGIYYYLVKQIAFANDITSLETLLEAYIKAVAKVNKIVEENIEDMYKLLEMA